MNDSSNDNNSSVTPYKASGNLNTSIGIPSIDVNDPMNMNIQSANVNATVVPQQPTVANVQNTPSVNVNTNANTNHIDPNLTVNIPKVNVTYNADVDTMGSDSASKLASSVGKQPTVDTDSGNSNEQDNKKKKFAIKVGPEFQLAILIIVLLLVFIFLLPIVNSLLGG